MGKPHISLDELRSEVEQCRKCPLCDGRTQTVFGAGNPSARVLIIGEAPGKNEDLQGVPFVGAAGKKLDALLAIAGLDRERDVFIANVLKCRPPGNRNPRAEEIEMCSPFLREQTRTINPEFIVTLGNFATKFILKTEVGITNLHGKLAHAGRFKVFPIYHPAAAIYDRNKQVALEEDFATLGELLRQSDKERALREGQSTSEALKSDEGASCESRPAALSSDEGASCENRPAALGPGESALSSDEGPSCESHPGALGPNEGALSSDEGALSLQNDEEFDPVAYINDPKWHSSVYGLERIERLLELMGRPQDRLKFVHVAGTNGKGSTCAYVSRILQNAGYRTGLFTSPFLIKFEERIRVNSEMIPIDRLREVTLFVRDCAEAVVKEGLGHPTEFELMTAVAFEYFAREKCDIAVVEVGLGGRLDSTNVIRNPEACVIARLGLDHTALLGDTLAAIASEKAGIIKDGAPVVCYPQDDDEATAVVRDAADSEGSVFVQPDFANLEIGVVNDDGKREFAYRGVPYTTSLLGAYQPFNAALAIECVLALRSRGWDIDDAAISSGIADTVWEGRFEVVEAGSGKPTVIVDGGHNPQGARALADSLASLYPNKKCVFVMGVLADKDYVSMIDTVLPYASAFMCVTPDSPRALVAGDLAQVISERALALKTELDVLPSACATFEEAIADAKRVAGEDGIVCAFGSLYSISKVKEALSSID